MHEEILQWPFWDTNNQCSHHHNFPFGSLTMYVYIILCVHVCMNNTRMTKLYRHRHTRKLPYCTEKVFYSCLYKEFPFALINWPIILQKLSRFYLYVPLIQKMRNIYKFHEFQEALISHHSRFDGIFFFFFLNFLFWTFSNIHKSRENGLLCSCLLIIQLQRLPTFTFCSSGVLSCLILYLPTFHL